MCISSEENTVGSKDSKSGVDSNSSWIALVNTPSLAIKLLSCKLLKLIHLCLDEKNLKLLLEPELICFIGIQHLDAVL